MKKPHANPGAIHLASFVIGAILLLFLAAGCKKKTPPSAPPPLPVTAAEVLVRNQPIVSEYIGQTRGSAEVEIRARVEGFLESVHFSEGLFVQKGDLLYVIDAKPYQALMAQAQGELARAQAAAANARGDVARYEPLIQRNAISRQQYDEAVATRQATAAAVKSAEAAVESAQLQLGYTRIVAPANGRIGKSEVQPGNLVGRGQNTLLTTVSVVNPIDVRFSVSEREYLEWRRQHPNEEEGRRSTTNQFELILADGIRYPHKGNVVFADRSVDPATATLLIEAAFPNPDFLIRPGQFVRVLFPRLVITNAVLIPQRAVRELQATFSVMVLTAENKTEMRPVKTGARVGSLWVIDSGLKRGERVVIAGVQKVQPGMVVNPTLTNITDFTEPSPQGNTR